MFSAFRGTGRYGPGNHDPLAHIDLSVSSAWKSDPRSLAYYCFRREIGTYPALIRALGASVSPYYGDRRRMYHRYIIICATIYDDSRRIHATALFPLCRGSLIEILLEATAQATLDLPACSAAHPVTAEILETGLIPNFAISRLAYWSSSYPVTLGPASVCVFCQDVGIYVDSQLVTV